MLRFITGRLVLTIPVLFGVSIIVFLLAHLAPGDVTTILAGPFATEVVKEKLRISFGLDQSLPVQYIKWLSHILQGDFGTSIANRRDVADLVFPKFVNTAILALSSAALAYIIGFFAGIFAAARPYSFSDRIVMGVTLMLGNAPPYWLGLLIVLLVSLNWRLLPATGMTNIMGDGGAWDVFLHLIQPMLTTAAAPACIVARIVRASMLEVLSQNYVRVARAKGMRRRTILHRHALRNALPPIITVCGLQLGYLLGGVLFVEVIFAWPGIGNQLWQAIQARDIPTIQGATLVIALAFVVVNLAVDVINAYLDPKIRASEKAGAT
ncbi:MAG: ABC transporter permease [Rhodospirillaceae bacterium]|jgi:peptide/nickel transport system permease protein|nr:ABC transporter permease [Rhodospirillaceae bacterium]